MIEEWEFVHTAMETEVVFDFLPVSSKQVPTEAPCVRGVVIYNGQKDPAFDTEHDLFGYTSPVREEGKELTDDGKTSVRYVVTRNGTKYYLGQPRSLSCAAHSDLTGMRCSMLKDDDSRWFCTEHCPDPNVKARQERKAAKKKAFLKAHRYKQTEQGTRRPNPSYDNEVDQAEVLEGMRRDFGVSFEEWMIEGADPNDLDEGFDEDCDSGEKDSTVLCILKDFGWVPTTKEDLRNYKQQEKERMKQAKLDNKRRRKQRKEEEDEEEVEEEEETQSKPKIKKRKYTK